MLKEDWFVKDSIKETLKNMIEASALSYLRAAPPDVFERLLVTEIQSISPYDEQKEIEVRHYIHGHIGELYQYAQELAAKKDSI